MIQNLLCFLQGRHALIYDKNTANETFEWVDFKEVCDSSYRYMYMYELEQ